MRVDISPVGGVRMYELPEQYMLGYAPNRIEHLTSQSELVEKQEGSGARQD